MIYRRLYRSKTQLTCQCLSHFGAIVVFVDYSENCIFNKETEDTPSLIKAITTASNCVSPHHYPFTASSHPLRFVFESRCRAKAWTRFNICPPSQINHDHTDTQILALSCSKFVHLEGGAWLRLVNFAKTFISTWTV